MGVRKVPEKCHVLCPLHDDEEEEEDMSKANFVDLGQGINFNDHLCLCK